MDYKVRFVNYPEHYRRIWSEITGSLSECLAHGDLIMRKQTEQFEANLADFIGVEHAIGLNSGTDALFFSLKAAGIGPGDEVITVSHTFVATIAAVHYCGAKPVLVDIGDDMNMDIETIKYSISPRTKAIIPVHLNGRMCDMDKIQEIANDNDLAIIEDAAQSLGASCSGKSAGSIGLTGCFSFYPAKILGCAGDGGAVATNDDKTADLIRLMRDHGYRRETGEILLYGYNSRLDNIQAAMLDIKLKYLPQWIKRRREIAEKYNSALKNISEIQLPPKPDNSGKYFDVFQNYVIRSSGRDTLRQYLQKEGIETLVSWPVPTHHHRALGLYDHSLPVTEKISKEVISLPLFPELEDAGVDYVISSLKNYFK